MSALPGICGRPARIVQLLIGAALFLKLANAADKPPPLVLEATIALPNTSGRIDHLGIDLDRQRLYVAELGNGSVDIIDLPTQKIAHRILGLSEPQGVLYVPQGDFLAVTTGGDGRLRLFSASDFASRGVVALGRDADNLQIDPRNGNIVVGYGGGALAIVDPAKAAIVKEVSLPDHPEGFQISAEGLAYVNVPDAHQITVVDLNSRRLIGTWAMPQLSANFPMVFGGGNTVAVVFRSPSRIVWFNRSSGRVVTENATCGDADDVYFDMKRQRIYDSCGAGAIGVFQMNNDSVVPLASISTSSGARTSLFVPEIDRLFVAVRAGLVGSDASIRVYRPQS